MTDLEAGDHVVLSFAFCLSGMLVPGNQPRVTSIVRRVPLQAAPSAATRRSGAV